MTAARPVSAPIRRSSLDARAWFEEVFRDGGGSRDWLLCHMLVTDRDM